MRYVRKVQYFARTKDYPDSWIKAPEKEIFPEIFVETKTPFPQLHRKGRLPSNGIKIIFQLGPSNACRIHVRSKPFARPSALTSACSHCNGVSISCFKR